jgi:hypothetical protein
MAFANDFYAAAAQVLPVLLLAITVEWRLGPQNLVDAYRDVFEKHGAAREQDKDTPRLWVPTWQLVLPTVNALALLATFALGEYGAFHALANQRATAADEVFVVGALLMSAFVALLIPVFGAVGIKIASMNRDPRRFRWSTWVALVGLVVSLPAYAMPAYGLYQLASSA